MWFKNLSLFRCTESSGVTAEELAARLAPAAFVPCGSQTPRSHGWVPPLGRRATDLVHTANGYLLVCLKTEEKLLPPTVVRERVAERVSVIEDREQRPVRRLERARLYDEVLHELLPQALTRSRQDYAYLDPRGGWLVVDSGNASLVSRLIEALQRALGGLPLAPLQVMQPPALVLTGWLAGSALPDDFSLRDECELQDSGSGGVVRCRGQDLNSAEMQAHLQAGKQVTRLALTWNDRLAFVLTEELSVRRLRFLDLIREQVGSAETAEQVFDAEFAVMTGELALLLNQLLTVFGGERQSSTSRSSG